MTVLLDWLMSFALGFFGGCVAALTFGWLQRRGDLPIFRGSLQAREALPDVLRAVSGLNKRDAEAVLCSALSRVRGGEF